MINLRSDKIQSLIGNRKNLLIIMAIFFVVAAIFSFILFKDRNKLVQLMPMQAVTSSNMVVGNSVPTFVSSTAQTSSLNQETLKAQRCNYNNQTYTAGDIVKIDQVWIKCIPTILFLPDRPTTPVYGSVVWAQVQ